MKRFIKQLLREMLLEARPMVHFKDRINQVINDIVSIQIPPNYYLPDAPKTIQDAWIIHQIQEKLKAKINMVISKDYPSGEDKPNRTGICVLVPLGLIKLQPIKGNPVNILITAKRKEGLLSGYSYYMPIYDNRIPSIVLANPKIPENSSPGNQLQAHMRNNLAAGEPVNIKESFVDKSFMDSIVIQMSQFKA